MNKVIYCLCGGIVTEALAVATGRALLVTIYASHFGSWSPYLGSIEGACPEMKVAVHIWRR